MTGAKKQRRTYPKLSAADRHVGSRIRLRRQVMGLTQQQLAKLVGVTSQQAHRYEVGLNRLTAGRLHAIALALGTDVAYFFEHFKPDSIDAEQQGYERRLLELTGNVIRISRPEYRHIVCELAGAMISRSEQPAPELA